MELFSVATGRDPYPLYVQLRATAPVIHVPGPDLWLALGFDAVKRVLHDHAAFSANVGPTRGVRFEWLLFADPPRHTVLRAAISRAFTPRSIAMLEPRIRELSRMLLDRVADRDDFDLVADYAAPLPMAVIAAMLGVPPDDAPQLSRWSETIMNLGNTIAGGDARRASDAFIAADRDMTAYFGDAIAARRARPSDDLIARLVAAELADDEIVRFCQLLLAAGTETTTNLIGNAMLCLAEHPTALAALRADRSRLPAAIEEVLRYRTPVQAMFRATRDVVDIDGVTIPGGRMVLAGIGAANRDPARFADPDRFDIAREPNPHLAFGHGIHFCLGAPLSRLEARIALDDLLDALPRFALVDPLWSPRGAFHVLGPATLRISRR